MPALYLLMWPHCRIHGLAILSLVYHTAMPALFRQPLATFLCLIQSRLTL